MQGLVDHLGQRAVDRVFGDNLPGRERLLAYLKRRMHRELLSRSEEQLTWYLNLLDQLTQAIRTGENFEEILGAIDAAETPAEEVA
jgi:hypothetical protein